jgi:crossover junction endodeoxyribonuclease RuvC
MATAMGIDPSLTSTGWVVLKDGEIAGHGTLESGKKDIERLLDLENQVIKILNKFCPDLIFIEEYAFSRGDRAHQKGEWGGILRRTLYLWFLGSSKENAWKAISPSAVKKFCTGKGNAKKEDMKLWAYKKWGIEFPANDEVDAYVLAKLAEKELAKMEGTA